MPKWCDESWHFERQAYLLGHAVVRVCAAGDDAGRRVRWRARGAPGALTPRTRTLPSPSRRSRRGFGRRRADVTSATFRGPAAAVHPEDLVTPRVHVADASRPAPWRSWWPTGGRRRRRRRGRRARARALRRGGVLSDDGAPSDAGSASSWRGSTRGAEHASRRRRPRTRTRRGVLFREPLQRVLDGGRRRRGDRVVPVLVATSTRATCRQEAFRTGRRRPYDGPARRRSRTRRRAAAAQSPAPVVLGARLAAVPLPAWGSRECSTTRVCRSYCARGTRRRSRPASRLPESQITARRVRRRRARGAARGPRAAAAIAAGLPLVQRAPTPERPFVFLHHEKCAGARSAAIWSGRRGVGFFVPCYDGGGVYREDERCYALLSNATGVGRRARARGHAGHFNWGVWDALPSSKRGPPPCLSLRGILLTGPSRSLRARLPARRPPRRPAAQRLECVRL